MKEGSVQEKATLVVKPIVEELGYILVDVTYKKEVSGMTLWVCIDKDGGVDINDCEKVSRALDIPLDEYDVTNGESYSFNVSSYGLDRAFKTDYDFNKHIGKLVDIKFYAPFNGVKSMTATLCGFDENKINVENQNQNTNIERKIIANICAHLEF